MTAKSATSKVTSASASTGSVQPIKSAGRKPTAPENQGNLIDRAPLTYAQQDYLSALIREQIGDEPFDPRALPVPDNDESKAIVIANLADDYGLSDESSDADVWRAFALAQQPDSVPMVRRQNWRNANTHAAKVLESFAGRDDRREALRAAAAKAKEKATAK